MPGTPELFVILLVVLLLFGPDKLPELARNIGKGVREVKKMTSEFQRNMNLHDDDYRDDYKNEHKDNTKNER